MRIGYVPLAQVFSSPIFSFYAGIPFVSSIICKCQRPQEDFMNENNGNSMSRRDFLKDTGRVTAASALTLAGAIPAVHAQGSSLINVAFVGCGGRGTGAALNALKTHK